MLTVTHGDIFNYPADAIISPANVSLLAGSGLCGVIHKRAGLKLFGIPFAFAHRHLYCKLHCNC